MDIDSNIAARYEAAKSFDLEDDLEYCPVLSIDEVDHPIPFPSPHVSESPTPTSIVDADSIIIGTKIL